MSCFQYQVMVVMGMVILYPLREGKLLWVCLVLTQRHRLGEQEANLRDNSSLCFYTRDLGCPQRGSDLCNAVHLACQAVLLPFFVAADRPDMCPLNGFVLKPGVLMAAALHPQSFSRLLRVCLSSPHVGLRRLSGQLSLLEVVHFTL